MDIFNKATSAVNDAQAETSALEQVIHHEIEIVHDHVMGDIHAALAHQALFVVPAITFVVGILVGHAL